MLAIAFLACGLSGPLLAQDTRISALPVKSGQAVARQWRCGMIIKAEGGGFHAIIGNATVPTDWPGQQRVRAVKEELTGGAKITYKMVKDMARQMVVRIPSLAAGDEARAIVTFEVESLAPPPPLKTDALQSPSAAKLDRKLAVFLTPSSCIESDSPEVRKLAKELVGGKETAVAQVRAIHDWVVSNIRFELNEGKQQTTPETLRDRNGDCDEMNSLAVALCRANQIPARLVRIPKHCYHEVYLLDGDARGHWLSCDATQQWFLSESALGIVLQKGDKATGLSSPGNGVTKQRFVAETLIGLPNVKGAKLTLQLVAEEVGSGEKGEQKAGK
jgi:hypothetical protein